MVTRREFTESVDKRDGPRKQPKFNVDGSRNPLYGYPRGVGESIPEGMEAAIADVRAGRVTKIDNLDELDEVPEIEAEEVPESIPDANSALDPEFKIDDRLEFEVKEEPVEKSIDEQIADLEAQKAELEK